MNVALPARQRTLWFLCRRFLAHLSVRRRWQLVGLLILTFIGVVADLATLGAVLPFLALLANPAAILRYPLVGEIAAFFGWRDATALLLPATLLFVAVVLVAGIIRTFLYWASLKFTFGVGADIGRDVYRRLLYQPFRYHASHNTSEAIASINNVNVVIVSFLNPLIQTFVSFVFIIAIVVALGRIDPWMASVAAFGFALIYVGATLATRRKLGRNSAVVARGETARILAIQEGLGGIRDVIIEGAQEIYVRRFWRFDSLQKSALASNGFSAALPRFLLESVGVALIAVIAYGSMRRSGTVEAVIPALGALALGAQKVMPHLQLVYFGWASTAGQKNVVADVVAKLDRPLPRSFPGTPTLPFTNVLTLNDVGFRYAKDAPDVIRNLSLEIPVGARVGFVGKTGSGKSTLIDLIMGLLEPTEGVIEIDGQPLSAANRRAWQAGIAHVPQSIFLSDTSIAENIAFGRIGADIDIDRVEEAARKAQLADFIASLPKKYDTFVGERGVRLSGGQRQRVGLARAFYKDAQILVLDEATSALDDATENKVMRAIYAQGKRVTVMIIAHRVTTLENCDFTVEVSSGGSSLYKVAERPVVPSLG